MWWALYAVWITVAMSAAVPTPFWTLCIASALAGLLHGVTTALLLDKYMVNNPWRAEKMQAPRGKLAMQFADRCCRSRSPRSAASRRAH